MPRYKDDIIEEVDSSVMDSPQVSDETGREEAEVVREGASVVQEKPSSVRKKRSRSSVPSDGSVQGRRVVVIPNDVSAYFDHFCLRSKLYFGKKISISSFVGEAVMAYMRKTNPELCKEIDKSGLDN